MDGQGHAVRCAGSIFGCVQEDEDQVINETIRFDGGGDGYSNGGGASYCKVRAIGCVEYGDGSDWLCRAAESGGVPVVAKGDFVGEVRDHLAE